MVVGVNLRRNKEWSSLPCLRFHFPNMDTF